MGREDRGFCSLVYLGQGVLPSCLSIPRAGIPEHLIVEGEKTMTAGVQPRWIQGIRSVDGVGVRKSYLLIDIRLD